MSSNLGSDIVNATATYGRVSAIITVVFVVIFGIIGVIAGIYLIRKKNPYTKNVLGTIISESPSIQPGQCTASVSYSLNGNSLKRNITVTQCNYKPGDTIKLQVDPSNPLDVREAQISGKVLGTAIILIAIIVVVFAVGNAYLVTKNKTIAAVEGTSDLINGMYRYV